MGVILRNQAVFLKCITNVLELLHKPRDEDKRVSFYLPLLNRSESFVIHKSFQLAVSGF